MPTPCSHYGCPHPAVNRGWCADHLVQRQRKYDSARPSQVGRYTGEWRRIRAQFLADNPYCARCGAIATEVHHVYGVEYGHDESGLSSRCKPCHSADTARKTEHK
ncbi:MAG: HNH endonuclease [Dehalococcoidia bacterium]|nr:HNH endonuclease [Dehalococcoidia bacterium]